MRSRLWIAASALLLAQCALRPPGPDAFSFAVMGDAPYSEREETPFMETLARIDREHVAFVVHVGDFKAGGHTRCSDELFFKRKAQFDSSAHPFIYTPGDNDWTDCRRKSSGGYDPIERLDRLRKIFFADGFSLGQERMATDVQPGFPENRLWQHGRVVFATIDVQGSNNNRGYDPRNEREADARDAANIAWLAAAESRASAASALVVFTQADLWVEEAKTYAIYVKALAEVAARLRKPVLFVHGDTHQYRFDTPFRDASGTPLANPTRLEVYGSPFVGWVKVDVDATRPLIFTAVPHLTALVP